MDKATGNREGALPGGKTDENPCQSFSHFSSSLTDFDSCFYISTSLDMETLRFVLFCFVVINVANTIG